MSTVVSGGPLYTPIPGSTIKIKRSEYAGNPAVLGAGELAYSGLADNGSNGGDRLYIGMGTETAGNAVNHVVIGGKYFTDQITAATAANTASTLIRRDASGNFAAGTITATLSGNASTAGAWSTSRSISITGDATWTTSVNGSADATGALTLATVNSNVGSFGSATSIPVVTVNAKGLVTGVSTATISTALQTSADSGGRLFTLGVDTMDFHGGTGVTTSIAGTSIAISIGQAVGPTDNVTFNNVAVNGTLSSDDITAANISVAGNATITGNLTVQGTTTTINSTTLAVGDKNIVLSKDAVDAAGADGAGLTVTGPSTAATFLYSSADDRWNLNKALNVATVYGALVGNASTATALATGRTIILTGDVTYTSGSFDGSGNVTGTATLAASGVAAGTYNSVTVDTKGRVTAGSFTETVATSDIGVTIQAYDADLSAIGALSGTSGILKKTATSTWILDTSTYLTGNESISVSGDATGTGTTNIALTLATVNSNVGSFGSSTSVPVITVNDKGLVTAVTTNSIPTATSSVLGLASFSPTNFSVALGAVSIAAIDGGTY